VFTIILACVYSQTQHIIVDKTHYRRHVSAQNVAILGRTCEQINDHCTALVGGDSYMVCKYVLRFRLKIIIVLTLSLLMSYVDGAPCKAGNFNVVYRV
jgi:hypothetical protein